MREAQPFDLEAFIAFVASKPADEEYDYCDNQGCPIFQFLIASGEAVNSVGPTRWHDEDGIAHDIPGGALGPLGDALVTDPKTFGALRARLASLTDKGVGR